MATHHNCIPISFNSNHIHYISQSLLVKANEESIRLGFSRTLEDLISQLPADLKFPIFAAWNHTSGEGLRNIRLNILIGTNADDLDPCFLDVTPDTWAKIKKNYHQRSIQEGK